jgi:CrcB protein
LSFGALLAVALGAVIGAYGRWALGAWFNGALQHLPLGTLIANALGGYLIGFALAWFAQHPGTSPELRLFVITGFLGALTTFSTFSAESIALLTRGEHGWALAHIALHLGCSLTLTLAGFQTVRMLSRA